VSPLFGDDKRDGSALKAFLDVAGARVPATLADPVLVLAIFVQDVLDQTPMS
jgi:hypothetical protein